MLFFSQQHVPKPAFAKLSFANLHHSIKGVIGRVYAQRLMLLSAVWLSGLLLSALWSSGLVAAPWQDVPAIDFSGRWENQRGSVLSLHQDGRGRLRGSFTTAVASTQECIGHAAPVTGTVNGNSLALSVDMTGCHSPMVIAMTGLLSMDGPTLKTQALIQRRGADTWNSQTLTTDFYSRESQ